jgi:hypothetical protein
MRTFILWYLVALFPLLYTIKKQMKGRPLEHDVRYNIWVFIKCFFYLPRWYFLITIEAIFKNKNK